MLVSSAAPSKGVVPAAPLQTASVDRCMQSHVYQLSAAPAQHRPDKFSPAALRGPVPAAHLQAHKPCTHSIARGVPERESSRAPSKYYLVSRSLCC